MFIICCRWHKNIYFTKSKYQDLKNVYFGFYLHFFFQTQQMCLNVPTSQTVVAERNHLISVWGSHATCYSASVFWKCVLLGPVSHHVPPHLDPVGATVQLLCCCLLATVAWLRFFLQPQPWWCWWCTLMLEEELGPKCQTAQFMAQIQRFY